MDLRTCHDSRCHLEDRTQQYHPVAMRPDPKFLFAILLSLTLAAFSAERLCNDTVSVCLSVCLSRRSTAAATCSWFAAGDRDRTQQEAVSML